MPFNGIATRFGSYEGGKYTVVRIGNREIHLRTSGNAVKELLDRALGTLAELAETLPCLMRLSGDCGTWTD